MLFSPCRDGVSHNESEHVEPDDIVRAAEVLLSTCILWLK
jgi:beta-ureidopropionase / N-carbamoyl-L-amino-acid hydrolase